VRLTHPEGTAYNGCRKRPREPMGRTQPTGAAVKEVAQLRRIEENIQRVFLGKPEAVRLVLVGLLSGGHVLIEDLPGVGKTLLARALARSIECPFARIQFTADMLPSDVLGVSVYDPERKRFEFKPGPVFTNILLADEINRCPPRTQSSLLEAMNEFQVTQDGQVHRLPAPFIVLATQNPHDLDGTYPLPESQRDRFLLRLSIGYPSHDDEMSILERQLTTMSVEDLEPVADAADVLRLQAAAREVTLSNAVREYLLQIVERTREHPDLAVGVSPRGGLMLSMGCKSLALLEGRTYCLPDDVKTLARPVLLHRLVSSRDGGPEGASEGLAAEALDDILREVPVPV